ncbi:MAG: 23S rRNA (pseudouridine(1915)-N(3))-methyltransferase RlmH [Lachnospiraceae bacterium]|nr:23S rRNA (pseudouridine(1915)-N(3))-methyltransferase RlmH [Lachnospiraceae bacterium]
MKITIICVGKIKEKFYTEAVNEYTKRLLRYTKVNICEVADERTFDMMSETEENLIKDKEGERIISKITQDMYVYALEIRGKQRDSVKFASEIDSLMVSGTSHICFIIGGSLGLSKNVLSRADSFLSFSEMTFPHQLMRVILAEQIYRCFRIINHEPYHK